MAKAKTNDKTTKIVDIKGAEVGELKLNGEVFGLEPNIHVMHLALKRQLNNARQGSANTKTRAEVSGGGKKPWKQKGTGRARAGSNRSPLFRGGGVIFGPKPRSYETDLPKKVRQLAIKSALSSRVENMVIVDDFSKISEIKTKAMVQVLKDINATGKILIVADVKDEKNKNLQLSARNLPNVKISLPTNLSVKDLIEATSVVITKDAINDITTRLS